jgi:sugar phosphate isomerase/epimerase
LRLSLSEISTAHASFEEDVVAYAAAGFDAIGIWEFKLPPDDDSNLALLAEHGLSVAVCIPTVPSVLQLGIPGMEGPADPNDRVEAICASIARLARYEPEAVACLPGPLGSRSEAEGRQALHAGLTNVAAAARAADVRLAFEPIHHTQCDAAGFVNSIEDAIAILSTAGLDDVGLLLDTYHLWDDPAVWDFIGRASYRIAAVHVSDWPSDTARTDRALPGEGRSQTKELIEALSLSGWDGILDVEIFSDRFWELAVDDAARQAYTAVAALR